MKYIFLYSSIIFNILTNVGFNLSAINDGVPLKKWGYLALGLLFGLINSVLFTECLKEIPLQVASAIFFFADHCRPIPGGALWLWRAGYSPSGSRHFCNYRRCSNGIAEVTDF